MPINLVRLSKTISHALRHAPEQYGLTLDEEGWTPIAELLVALRHHRREWRNISVRDLETMIEQADKQRYEIHGDRIRACYGHSVSARIKKTPGSPPDVLYHGTSPRALPYILRDGLRPMNRQYVHLSADEHTAYLVGSRHAPEPVILRIDARAAHAAEIRFYHGNDDIWLADTIPPQFILSPTPPPDEAETAESADNP